MRTQHPQQGGDLGAGEDRDAFHKLEVMEDVQRLEDHVAAAPAACAWQRACTEAKLRRARLR